ncbi:DUF2971 domain-containing protein [Microbulbifer sp. CnH-101-G]|uniref:DUF2971 domain-containing protein n=1 Tax=Microbulbifer sp. CnH-101-G TaxID=3243393 RepID=UPI0040397A06
MNKKDIEKYGWHYGQGLPGLEEVPILYQYMPLEKAYIDTLEARSFYVSDPKKFNDPFDCWAYIDSDSMSADEYTHFLRAFSASKRGVFREDDIDGMTRDFQEKGDGSAFLGKLRDVFSSVAEAFGVLCFSSEWNSFLMWSHYAKSHSGICVGYKRDGLQIEGGSEKALPVQYKNPAIHLQKMFHEPGGLVTDETARAFLHTKIQDWAYEREWRLVTNKEYAGNKIAWEACETEIVEVVFGMKTPQKEIDSFVKLLRKMGIKINCVLLAYDPVKNNIFRYEEFTS